MKLVVITKILYLANFDSVPAEAVYLQVDFKVYIQILYTFLMFILPFYILLTSTIL